tara:strand:+ start:13 stop:147 length:135 start_codon:yes stop_codon:yes gene_type:complete
MNKKNLEFHKKEAKRFEKNSDKMAKSLGLTKECLRELAKKNKIN